MIATKIICATVIGVMTLINLDEDKVTIPEKIMTWCFGLLVVIAILKGV